MTGKYAVTTVIKHAQMWNYDRNWGENLSCGSGQWRIVKPILVPSASAICEVKTMKNLSHFLRYVGSYKSHTA
jgi:hypothetical protein